MRWPRRLIPILACSAVVCLPAAAQAGFAPSAQPLSDPVDGIQQLHAAVDAGGRTYAAWEEVTNTMPTLTEQIVGRPVAADGSLGPRMLLSVPDERSFNPVVAVSADGRAFVAWETNGLPNSVKGRWVEPDGTPGPLVTLLDAVSGTEDAAHVRAIVGTDGMATVSWYNQSSAGNSRIEVRQVFPDSVRGPQLNSPMSSDGGNFDMASLPGGSTFFVAGANTNVLDPLGQFSTPVSAKQTGTVSTLHTGMAFDSQGNGLIAWRRGLSSPMAVIARRIDPAGAPIGDELIVEPDTTDFIGADQEVAADSNGHFLVGYRRQDSGNDSHSYVRAANADGSFADVAHAVSPVGQSEPIVALDDRGVGLAVFAFTAPGSMSSVVDGQLLGPGATPFGDLTPLSGGDRAGSPSLANNPATGVATVTWAQLQGSKDVAMARRYLEPPTCTDSTATVAQGRPIDAPLACAGIGVNGARVVTAPAHGKVGAFSMTGPSIRYTPTPGYQGHDSFVVEGLNDGGGSNDVTVRVAVNRDTIRPTIKTFKLRRMRAAAAKRKRTTSPYSFALKYSEPSTVKVKIQRPVRGIRSGRRCRIARPGTHGGRCTIYKTLGSVSSKKLADATALRVPTRLVKRLSKYGAVRATATARDAAGNASKPRRLKARFKL